MNRFLLPLVLLLSGCASFSPDGGMDRVAALTRERTGQAPPAPPAAESQDSAAQRAAELLRAPLAQEGAVELALLQHRGLQARFAALGVAEADRVRAGRLANPVLGFGRLREGGGALEIERSLVFNLLGLLTLPAAQRVEQERFAQAQTETAAAAVEQARQAREAWTEAVAAQQLVQYFAQVQDAADAANVLARRMVQAGNFPALAQMREQAFHAEAVADLARARHRALAARERLVRALGLSGAQLHALQLPARLPGLPPAQAVPVQAEDQAIARRLDLLAARQRAEALARQLGLAEATGFVNLLELGVQSKSSTGAPRTTGWEAAVELPLFDFGRVRWAGAEARYRQSLHEAADVALQARSEVRESWSAYRTAHGLARHWRDEVVPLRQRIAEQNLLRYNGMLIGVFELLADAREQVRSVAAAVEALRDFWLADSRLQQAMAVPPSPPSPPSPTPPSSPNGHAGH
ncbi:TolC family protein [Pseudorhodoferax sp. Leaf274]|uniref:TolC family protein n=1 Tax=Pseudorhodoferax sp. Leaf274 TaxID=1736318 RepID=UPI000702D9D8|nr:TolC family protein [Pseudorhodoferax sp. Leaf274]KQP47653.1 RND transporter [Pseudorhodoferax sp. Leaf274]